MKAEIGCPTMPGLTWRKDGCNFTIDTQGEKEVSLLLYEKGKPEPVTEIPFESAMRFGNVCSMFVSGIHPEKWEYNYRIDGVVCQDPRASAYRGRETFGEPCPENEHAVRCACVVQRKYCWENDASLNIGFEDLILYKLHIRGFSKGAGRRVKHPGTFAGLRESIPYLQDLGINAVEIMPCYEFAEVTKDTHPTGMVTRKTTGKQVNFWGYTRGCYFAPKSSFTAGKRPENEMRDLVKALHAAGILCILEFYFPENMQAQEALDALHFWKLFYHVDGFHIIGNHTISSMAVEDGILADTMLFYTGNDGIRIPAGRKRNVAFYSETFWQDVRRMLKSDEDMVGRIQKDLRANAKTYGVINTITSQDGFTLQDLVSYNYRHNEENGQENRDGCAYNYSWNCGIEGPTKRGSIRKIREKQKRNAFLFLLLGQGIPMIYAGDEFGNSQQGNNNAWCQDNATGWLDWRGFRKNQKLHDFVRDLIAFRKAHPIFHMKKELAGSDFRAQGFPDVSFHGERAWMVNYENTSRMLGVLYNEAYAEELPEDQECCDPEKNLYIAYNFHWEERRFALPTLPEGYHWESIVDSENAAEQGLYRAYGSFEKYVTVGPRSIRILIGRKDVKEG